LPEIKTRYIISEEFLEINIPIIKNKKRQLTNDNLELLSKELNEKNSLFSVLKNIFYRFNIRNRYS